MDRERVAFNIEGLAVKLTPEQPVYDAAALRGLHFHGEAELVYVTSGSILLSASGETFALGEGDAAYIGGGTVHRLCPNGFGGRCFIAQLDVGGCLDVPSPVPVSYGLGERGYLTAFLARRSEVPCRVFRRGDEPELAEVIGKLSREFYSGGRYSPMFIKSYLYNLAALLLRSGAVFDETRPRVGDIERLAPALAYIDGHSASRVTLADAAGEVNLDRTYFCKLFRMSLGAGFTDYLNFVRMMKAAELLLGGSSVTSAALEAGFSTPQYFIRVFRKYFGCTPSKYGGRRPPVRA